MPQWSILDTTLNFFPTSYGLQSPKFSSCQNFSEQGSLKSSVILNINQNISIIQCKSSANLNPSLKEIPHYYKNNLLNSKAFEQSYSFLLLSSVYSNQKLQILLTVLVFSHTCIGFLRNNSRVIITESFHFIVQKSTFY